MIEINKELGFSRHDGTVWMVGLIDGNPMDLISFPEEKIDEVITLLQKMRKDIEKEKEESEKVELEVSE